MVHRGGVPDRIRPCIWVDGNQLVVLAVLKIPFGPFDILTILQKVGSMIPNGLSDDGLLPLSIILGDKEISLFHFLLEDFYEILGVSNDERPEENQNVCLLFDRGLPF